MEFGEERDFFKEPFTEQELREVIRGHSASEVFSWSSPSFKKLGLNRDDLDDDSLVQLMLEEPRLIRRPLFRAGDRLVIGASKKTLDEAFPG